MSSCEFIFTFLKRNVLQAKHKSKNHNGKDTLKAVEANIPLLGKKKNVKVKKQTAEKKKLQHLLEIRTYFLSKQRAFINR